MKDGEEIDVPEKTELEIAQEAIDQWAANGAGADENEAAGMVEEYEYQLRAFIYVKLFGGIAGMAATELKYEPEPELEE